MKDTTPGLTAAQAAERLRLDGYNELPAKSRRTVFHIVLEVVREPMFMLLIGAGAIYLVLGDRSDALMLLGFVFITMGITIVQERRTERVLETLKDLSSPRALVLRDGRQARIPGREVVTGDTLVLEEGDRVAADGVVIESHDLLIDESLLTGESVPVAKEAAGEGDAGPEQRVYSGSMVLQGGGLVRVDAIGGATAIGKIGRSLQAQTAEPSPLQREIRTLVQRFALLGAAVSLLVVVLFAWFRGDWLNGLLAGITLAMSILPEEFTVILTVFMALGAWRISRNHVLTRRTAVIEALGSATVLCVDKTGTLTENRMTVKSVVAGAGPVLAGLEGNGFPGPAEEVIEYAVLSSESNPFDPMEQAFHRFHAECSAGPGKHAGWSLVHEYPLTKQLLAMTHVWRTADGAYAVATKGAPEAVARACRLPASRVGDILQQVEALARQGMRVIGVARARHAAPPWPPGQDGLDLEWLGLVGLADPLRPQVRSAVAECHQAGMRVMMITGDYPVTAQTIAQEAGLPSERVMTGADMDAMPDDALRAAVQGVHVFARILPEQKLRLVNALKSNGEVVAMTGDGVNDAPALKAAHIGISMGERGTDVAREASSLVLLNDDFTSIVHAARLGRRIYDNLRKAMTYIVAVHIPIAGMTILPLVLGTPLAFAPVHIVFIEMIINPTCAIVFETEGAERDIMQRPPRGIHDRLFGPHSILLAVLQGAGLLAAVAATYFGGLRDAMPVEEARTLAFTVQVIGSACLIVANRSLVHSFFTLIGIPNRAQWWILGGTFAALMAVLSVPFLREVFHFSAVDRHALAWAVLSGFACLGWFELVKFVFKTRTRRQGAAG
ncbi:cation-translocating P-type ATPase [Pseudoduganella sp. GCM10020061]|uniref:cation-translocating P-type ATPase n=1 Tax=Pseudoduganella sp. GCM10020061 TaxID=3317345 RepID=UPI0036262143